MTIAKKAYGCLRTLCHPVTFLVIIIHKAIRLDRHKRVTKCSIGVTLMLTGSYMALHPIETIPHVVWDMTAYGLHAYGTLPVMRVICMVFNLEDVDSSKRAEKKPTPARRD